MRVIKRRNTLFPLNRNLKRNGCLPINQRWQRNGQNIPNQLNVYQIKNVGNNLGSVPQKYFEDNRNRFEAETTAFELKNLKDNRCTHHFFRKNWGQIECKRCRIGYFDNNIFKIKEGKLALE